MKTIIEIEHAGKLPAGCSAEVRLTTPSAATTVLYGRIAATTQPAPTSAGVPDEYVAILHVGESETTAAYRIDALSTVPIGEHRLYLDPVVSAIPAPRKVPSQMPEVAAHARGWNECRAEVLKLLAARPTSEAGAVESDPSTAAIQFALETHDGLEFLRYWNEGKFDVVRRLWVNAPETIFMDADPLHKTPPRDQGGSDYQGAER